MRSSFIYPLLLFFAPMVFAEAPSLNRNTLKNRSFDKEASQNSHLEQATIVRAHTPSEDRNFEKKPASSETDSSGCFGITFLTPADAAQARGQHFLLTYARSGTNLTSCYLQYLTGKPIKFLFHENTFLAENRLNAPLDYSKPILYRTHYPKDMKMIDNRNNKLLYVLRNFKESILRHNYQKIKSAEEYRDLFKKNDAVVREYMKGLEIYDNWEPSMRLLILYEDLLTDPVATMAQVLAFFEEPIPARLTLESLKKVNAKTLASYHKQHKNCGGSHSKGEDLFYHTRNLPLDILKDIDISVESNYPFLWTNYLKKYQS